MFCYKMDTSDYMWYIMRWQVKGKYMKHSKFRVSPLDEVRHIQITARANEEAFNLMPSSQLIIVLPAMLTNVNCWLHQTDTKMLGLCNGNKKRIKKWASRADKILRQIHMVEKLSSSAGRVPLEKIVPRLAMIEAYRSGANSTLAMNGIV